MSKRLQVVLDEAEMDALRAEAARNGVTVSEWVRASLRSAHRAVSSGEPARKLAAVRSAAKHHYPTAGIEQMLAEIERGYVEPEPTA